MKMSDDLIKVLYTRRHQEHYFCYDYAGAFYDDEYFICEHDIFCVVQ